MEPDYYDLLQVSPEADSKAVIAAYRRLARQYHPDIASDPDATEYMRTLNRAVEVLGDPGKRREYDRQRLQDKAREALKKDSPAPGTEAPPSQSQPPLPRPSTGVPPSRAMVRRDTAVGMPRASGPRRSHFAPVVVSTAIVLGLLSVVAIWLVADSDDGARQAAQRQTTTAPATASETPLVAAASAAPDSSTPIPPGSAIFESRGTWLIGAEMTPGIWRGYRATQCSWIRMTAADNLDRTVAGSGSTTTVEIKPTDVAFWSDGCGWWTQILTPPSASPPEPFGAGTWLIPQEIAPGRWRNSDSSEGCSWALLNGLDGGPSAVLTSGVSNDTQTVLISSEVAFHSRGCGVWTRIGD
jgi:DnaJ domain